MKNTSPTYTDKQVIVLRPPYEGDHLTAILRLVMEAAERGERCPLVPLADFQHEQPESK